MLEMDFLNLHRITISDRRVIEVRGSRHLGSLLINLNDHEGIIPSMTSELSPHSIELFRQGSRDRSVSGSAHHQIASHSYIQPLSAKDLRVSPFAEVLVGGT